MKKNLFLIAGICLLTSACATSITDSTMGKMKTCLTEQAMQSLTDGSLTTNGITATAKTISNSCLKSLAMQNLGIDNQTTQMATTILSTLSAAKAQ